MEKYGSVVKRCVSMRGRYGGSAGRAWSSTRSLKHYACLLRRAFLCSTPELASSMCDKAPLLEGHLPTYTRMHLLNP
eukprot:12554-Eustigmatos_ZCMA.PRE.1